MTIKFRAQCTGDFSTERFGHDWRTDQLCDIVIETVDLNGWDEVVKLVSCTPVPVPKENV